MSYCIAWKHDNNVFMLSDTAVSSRVDEPSVPYNSMGEKQTMDDMGLLESIAYGDFEIPEDISKLPFNC